MQREGPEDWDNPDRKCNPTLPGPRAERVCNGLLTRKPLFFSERSDLELNELLEIPPNPDSQANF